MKPTPHLRLIQHYTPTPTNLYKPTHNQHTNPTNAPTPYIPTIPQIPTLHTYTTPTLHTYPQNTRLVTTTSKFLFGMIVYNEIT